MMKTLRDDEESGKRADSYPREYYRQIRKRQVCAAIVAVCLALWSGKLAYQAVFGPEDVSVEAAASVAVFLLVFWGLLAQVRGRHGIAYIVPYFKREVGGPKTFLRGAALARNCGFLDSMAVRAGLRPISAFGYRDNLFFVNWPMRMFHDPARGLETIARLMEMLCRDPGPVNDAAEVIADLERISERLELAARDRVPFCFHLRMHDEWISLAEFDNRSGYY